MRSVIIFFENGNVQLLDAIKATIEYEDEELDVYWNDPCDYEDTEIVGRNYDLVMEGIEKVLFDRVQVWPREAEA